MSRLEWSQDGNDDDDGDQLVDGALFAVEDVPPPAGGTNLAALEASLRARGVDALDLALAEQARTGATALDRALRGKNPAYAVAALFKPYHEVLTALGLGGVVGDGAGPDPAAEATAKLLEAFGAGPAAPVPDAG